MSSSNRSTSNHNAPTGRSHIHDFSLEELAADDLTAKVSLSATCYRRFGLYDAEEDAPYGDAYPTRREAEDALQDLTQSIGPEEARHMEVRVRSARQGVLIATSAPVDYDGFSTTRLADLGEEITLAVVDEEDLSWQLQRYGSGMEVGVTLAGLLATLQGATLYAETSSPNGSQRPLWAVVPVGVRTLSARRTALSGPFAIRRALAGTEAAKAEAAKAEAAKVGASGVEASDVEALIDAACRTFSDAKRITSEMNAPFEEWLDEGGQSAMPTRYNLALVGDLFAPVSDGLEEGLPLGPLFAREEATETRDLFE